MILLITQLIQIGFFILLVFIIFAFMQRLQYEHHRLVGELQLNGLS